jgi:septal ring factor EnvC (AmiA/AmiB activator)
MSLETDITVAAEYEAEIARLRERVASLEAKLLETEAWTNRVVAEAQDRTYWLDRLNLDLNALMRRTGANRIRRLARSARAVHRTGKNFGRQPRS